VNPDPCAPAGLGVAVTCQRVPSQSSARVSCVDAVALAPAARQVPAGSQDTPLSSAAVLPSGTGTGWTAHRVPSHRSASGRGMPAARYSPTAVQARGVVQERPNSPVSVAPAGLGTDWTLQRLPSHRSVSDTSRPAAVTDQPTAAQSVAVTQDTPFRTLQTTPAGFGVAWTAQVPPVRRSARVRPVP
jgi:hypothetical protein